MNSSNAENAPWDRCDGCFSHCDPEGWYAPCRASEEKMVANIRGVLAWRQKYAPDGLTPEAFDHWLAAHDAEQRQAGRLVGHEEGRRAIDSGNEHALSILRVLDSIAPKKAGRH